MAAVGLTYEELEPGVVYHTARVTVTESAIIDFALRWDPQPFHIDRHFRDAGISVNGKPVGVEEPEDDEIRPLSDRVIEDLTAARAVALRSALANDPVMAFIASLHVAVLKIFYRYGTESCLEITLQHTAFSQTQGLGDTVWAKEIEQRQES